LLATVHAVEGPASGAPDEDALEDDDEAEDDEAEDDEAEDEDEEALDALDEVELDPPALDDEAVLLPLPLQPTPAISEKRKGTASRAGDMVRRRYAGRRQPSRRNARIPPDFVRQKRGCDTKVRHLRRVAFAPRPEQRARP
jgi:hypothetical protein